MNRHNKKAKPRRPPLQSTRLFDQLRERIRYLHYSINTEKTYVYWVQMFVRWHKLCHPAQMGKAEVELFLMWLANERGVAPSTHRQALSAILFLYKEVLDIELPWLNEIGRPKARERLPTVLSRDEIGRILAVMDGEIALLAKLLYGTGMRLTEGLRLRVKDVDFDHRSIVVREGKGGKDRVVMLPQVLDGPIREQLVRARAIWSADRTAGRPGVWLPCRMHCRRNIHGLHNRGPGTGFFRRPRCLSILAQEFSAVITCTKNACNAQSKRRSLVPR